MREKGFALPLILFGVLVIATIIGSVLFFRITPILRIEPSPFLKDEPLRYTENRNLPLLLPKVLDNETNEVKSWKPFRNTKYKYSLKYPDDYNISHLGAYGCAQNSCPIDEMPDVVLGDENFNIEEYYETQASHLEIYAYFNDHPKRSLEEISVVTYEKNLLKAERASSLEKFTFVGKDAYIYELYNIKTFSPAWGVGTVLERKNWKVINTENDRGIISIFYTPNDTTENVVSTFKFE